MHPFVLSENELKKSSFWGNISPTYQKASVTISDSYLCFWLTTTFCISLNTLEDKKSPSGLLMFLFCLELTGTVICNVFEKCSSPHSGSLAGWVHTTFIETINMLQMLPFLSSYTNYRLTHHQALVEENSTVKLLKAKLQDILLQPLELKIAYLFIKWFRGEN